MIQSFTALGAGLITGAAGAELGNQLYKGESHDRREESNIQHLRTIAQNPRPNISHMQSMALGAGIVCQALGVDLITGGAFEALKNPADEKTGTVSMLAGFTMTVIGGALVAYGTHERRSSSLSELIHELFNGLKPHMHHYHYNNRHHPSCYHNY